MSNWTAITESTPPTAEDGQLYLVVVDNLGQRFIDVRGWYGIVDFTWIPSYPDTHERVTHWMELPELPPKIDCLASGR